MTPITKKCGSCGLDMPEAKFARRGRIRQAWCKKCRKKYDQTYWKKNRERRIAQCEALKQKNKKWLRELKETLKCSRCDENDPACLDFHHRDSSQKVVEVSNAVGRGWGKDRILAEIAKCDVLCSNCHRKEHTLLRDATVA